VATKRIHTLPLGRYLRRIPSYELKDHLFDRLSARYLDSPDLFHGWNNMCRRSLTVAEQAGATTVVERASTLPVVQRRLVEREFDEYADGAQFTSDRRVRRATAELGAADAVLVPSEFVYKSFLDEGFEESKLHLVPFGVDADQFSPSPVDDGEFSALFVGQVSLRKGVQYLLPAWQSADVSGTLRLAGEVTENAEAVVDRYRDDPLSSSSAGRTTWNESTRGPRCSSSRVSRKEARSSVTRQWHQGSPRLSPERG